MCCGVAISHIRERVLPDPKCAVKTGKQLNYVSAILFGPNRSAPMALLYRVCHSILHMCICAVANFVLNLCVRKSGQIDRVGAYKKGAFC